eukprot:jgi/Ulvmu1/11515/UM078_0004.1
MLQRSLCSKDAASAAIIGVAGCGKPSFINSVASSRAADLVQLASAGQAASSFTRSIKLHRPHCKGHEVQWDLIDVPGDVMQTLVSMRQNLEQQSLSHDQHTTMILKHLEFLDYPPRRRGAMPALFRFIPIQMLGKWRPRRHAASTAPALAWCHTSVASALARGRARVGCVVLALDGVRLSAAVQAKEAELLHDVSPKPPSQPDVTTQLQVAHSLHVELANLPQPVRMVFLMTKMDLVDTGVAQGSAAMRCSPKVSQLQDFVANSIGVPKNTIFPVVNMVGILHPHEDIAAMQQSLRCMNFCIIPAAAAAYAERSLPAALASHTMCAASKIAAW